MTLAISVYELEFDFPIIRWSNQVLFPPAIGLRFEALAGGEADPREREKGWKANKVSA